MSEHTKRQRPVEAKASKKQERVSKLLGYDPYKIFDSRKGCIAAVALCILLITIFVLNGLFNGNWLSLIFVPLYGLIIRNRLRKLRAMS